MLSKQAIKEFQEIYCTEYGEMLSFDEAAKQASNLIQLYKNFLSKSDRRDDIKIQHDD